MKLLIPCSFFLSKFRLPKNRWFFMSEYGRPYRLDYVKVHIGYGAVSPSSIRHTRMVFTVNIIITVFIKGNPWVSTIKCLLIIGVWPTLLISNTSNCCFLRFNKFNRFGNTFLFVTCRLLHREKKPGRNGRKVQVEESTL